MTNKELSKELVLDTLKGIQEPDWGRSFVELNLIRDVLIRDGRVNLTLVLSEVDEAVKTRLEQQVKQTLAAIGANEVHIRFRQITDFEKSELNRQLQNANSAESSGESGQNLDAMQAKTQAELKAQGMPRLLEEGSKTKFIAVASGKGGVGKSTVTVNLAVALARKGKKVGIIDADIYGFSIPDMMGIEEAPKLVDNQIIPVERLGVKVISMGFFVEDNAPVIWRGPMLGKMLRNFFNEVSWGEVDYMLLDLPPGTGDIALDVHQMIPQSKEILVTTPHATAAFVAARAGAMAKHTNHDVLGVVENMAYYVCGKCGNKDYIYGRGGGAKLAEEMNAPLLAQIPLGAPDNHPHEADYTPSVYKADTEVGQMYLDLAAKIVEQLEQ